MKKYSNYLGIDVSKKKLDISLFNGKTHRLFKTESNEYNSAKSIIENYKINNKTTKVIMESTGIYHTKISSAFYDLGYEVVVHNAANIKCFIGATGQQVKTDKSDSKLIAEYGYIFNPESIKPKSTEQLQLIECLVLLRQVTIDKVKNLNRKEAIDNTNFVSKFIINESQKDKKYYDDKIARIWVHIEKIVKLKYNDLFELYTSIPGVGRHIAITIIAYFGKFENFSNSKKVQSFLGTCSSVKESGSSVKGSGRITRRGNSSIRNILYLGSLSARTYNPFAKTLYERLIKKGKSGKLGMVAILNKLIRQLYAIGKSGKKFDSDYLIKREKLLKVSEISVK